MVGNAAKSGVSTVPLQRYEPGYRAGWPQGKSAGFGYRVGSWS